MTWGTLISAVTGFLAKLGPWLLTWLGGKKSANADALQTALDNAKKADDMEDGVSALTGDDVRDRLSKWSRD